MAKRRDGVDSIERTARDEFASRSRDVHPGTGECIDVKMTFAPLLFRHDCRKRPRVVFNDVQLDLRPIVDYVEFKGGHSVTHHRKSRSTQSIVLFSSWTA